MSWTWWLGFLVGLNDTKGSLDGQEEAVLSVVGKELPTGCVRDVGNGKAEGPGQNFDPIFFIPDRNFSPKFYNRAKN